VGLCFVVEARDERRDAHFGFDLRGIEGQLARPDVSHFLTQVDDVLEEALEDVNTESLADAGEARVIRQLLVERVAQIPAMSQVQIRCFDQLPLRADAF
jgi:hypothetical protein